MIRMGEEPSKAQESVRGQRTGGPSSLDMPGKPVSDGPDRDAQRVNGPQDSLGSF